MQDPEGGLSPLSITAQGLGRGEGGLPRKQEVKTVPLCCVLPSPQHRIDVLTPEVSRAPGQAAVCWIEGLMGGLAAGGLPSGFSQHSVPRSVLAEDTPTGYTAGMVGGPRPLTVLAFFFFFRKKSIINSFFVNGFPLSV